MPASEFTLSEFTLDGNCPLYAVSTDMEGNIMVFPTFEAAADMARFIVEDPSSFPLVGIDEGVVEEDGEHTAWSAGWVQRDSDGTTSVHDGSYDDDADWTALVAAATA